MKASSGWHVNTIEIYLAFSYNEELGKITRVDELTQRLSRALMKMCER